MASRDYLIRQVEEMALFLSILLRRILKLKEENNVQQMEDVVKEALLNETNLDIEQIVALENEVFLSIVQDHFKSEGQMDQFADILMVMGKEIVRSFSLTRANYLQKSLFLFNYLQENTTVFSYDRRTKILEIQELLLERGMM